MYHGDSCADAPGGMARARPIPAATAALRIAACCMAASVRLITGPQLLSCRGFVCLWPVVVRGEGIRRGKILLFGAPPRPRLAPPPLDLLLGWGLFRGLLP